LGLAIARELAHAHGGDVTLVSSDATGTVFAIDLPARRPAS
jgi:signal transduction histidine kinase